MYCFSPEHPPLTELVQRTSNWALDDKISEKRVRDFQSGRNDGKERFPVLRTNFGGFDMDRKLQCKLSPSVINYEECIRWLNWIESNVAAIQQMQRALPAAFHNRFGCNHQLSFRTWRTC